MPSTSRHLAADGAGPLTVLDTAPDAIFVVEQDGTIAYLNHAAERLFQLKASDAGLLSIDELIPSRMRDGHAANRRRFVEGGMHARAMGEGRELTARRRDGTEFVAEVSLSAVEWDGRQCIAAAVRDATARQETVRSLQHALNSLAALFDASPAAVIALDRRGCIREWSAAAVSLLGVPRKQALGKRLTDVHHEWGEALARIVFHVADVGAVTDVPISVQRADGQELDLRVSTTLLDGDSDIPLLLLISDDSARRHADRLEREHREQLRALVQHSPDLIIRFDAAACVCFVNDTTVLATDTSESQWLGRSVDEMPVMTIARTAWREQLRHVLTTGESSASEVSVETTCGLRVFDCWLVPELNEQGTVHHAVLVARDITERLNTQAELSNSEEQLALTVETMAEGLVAVDANGVIAFTNVAAARVLGVASESLIGQDLLRAGREWYETTGALLARDAHPMSESFAAGHAVHARELVLRREDGARLVVRMNAAPLTGEDNRIVGGVITLTDITDQQRQHEVNALFHDVALAIRSTNSSHAAMQMALRVICDKFGWTCANAWTPRADGMLVSAHVTYCPREGPEAFGSWAADVVIAPDDSLAGRAYRERRAVWMMHDQQRAGGQVAGGAPQDAFDRLAARQGFGTSLALPVLARDRILAVLTLHSQEQRMHDCAHERLLDSVGAQLGEAMELRDTMQALATSEGRLRAIVNGAPIGIALLDSDGVIQSANHALTHFLGLDESTLTSGLTWASLLEDPLLWTGEPLAADAEAGEWHMPFTTRFRRPDGNMVWGRCRLAQVQRQVGRLTVAMVEDITAQLEADHRARASEELLAESRRLEAVGRLAGGIAHDFNNLLAVIRTTCDLLSGSPPTNAATEEYVQAISAAAEHGTALTRQLLAYSRRQATSPVPVDAAATVRGMLPMLSRMIGPTATLHDELTSKPAWILADSTQLEQVVINLTVNARDAMPGGGVVTVRCTQSGGVRIEVQDEGTGIEDAVRERIFEPFFSTKAPEAGSGIGLATVHNIVTQSGGTIEVESVKGAGTTFRVIFPAAHDVAAVPALQPVLSPVSTLRDSLRGVRVLLVDDLADVRASVERSLRYLGCEVQGASGADEALAYLSGDTFDLLLTDVAMPGTDGIALARRVRAQDRGLPILFMSGYSEASGVPEMELLCKPFGVAELAIRARSVLQPTASLAGRAGESTRHCLRVDDAPCRE